MPLFIYIYKHEILFIYYLLLYKGIMCVFDQNIQIFIYCKKITLPFKHIH